MIQVKNVPKEFRDLIDMLDLLDPDSEIQLEIKFPEERKKVRRKTKI